MGARQLVKGEKRDEALYKYVAQRYGFEGLSPDIGGEGAFNLAQFKRQGEHGYDVVESDGTGKHVIFDETGKEIFKTSINAVGFEDKWQWAKKEMDYQHGLELQKLKFKHGLETAGEGMTGPQFAGYDLYTTVQGTSGETLYKHHDNGGTYYYDKTANILKPYWGSIQKFSATSQAGQVKDILSTLEQNQDVFAPEILSATQMIFLQN
jgi:hypothetical protein